MQKNITWYRVGLSLSRTTLCLALGFGSVLPAISQAQTQAAPAAADTSSKSVRLQVQGDHALLTDTKGQVKVAMSPKNVIVFDLATLDILAALGVDAVKGVPTFKMPAHLSQYETGAGYQKVGSLFEPDYEAIQALGPDLIFIGRRTEARYADLNRLAPTVDMAIDESNPVESVYSNVRTLGALFGKQERAEELIAQTQKSIDALHAVAPNAGTALMLLSSGGRINNYGPGSRFGMLFDVFGFTPVKDDPTTAARHGQAISFEYILQANPDWLFVLDRDSAIGREGEAAKRLLNNGLVNATNAAKNGHIVYLDGVNWYLLDSAGITALKANVDQLLQAVQAPSGAAPEKKAS